MDQHQEMLASLKGEDGPAETLADALPREMARVRVVLGELAHTGDPADFRARVDDVRGERGQCVRRMADGLICGLRATSCPDCGPAVHDVPEGA